MAANASDQRKGRRPGKRRRRLARFILLAAAALAVLAFGVISGAAISALRTIPTLAGTAPRPSLSSTILDAEDKPVTNVYDTENRERVKIDDIPKHVQDAFVSVEDERFWKHYGIDFTGIARALYNDISNRKLQGGSTITQQLARNAFPIGRERSLRRKVQEAILALELERRYTKKEILEMYLNHIYFGRDAYGIEVASRTYFGKPAKDLTVAEGALLAGLPQAPNLYQPIDNPEPAQRRRNLVLELMAQQDYITPDRAAAAKKEPVVTVSAPKRFAHPEAHFVDYVLAQLLKKYPPDEVYRGGLKIYTTLDTDIQRAAVEAVSRNLDKEFPLGQGKEQPQAAVVVLDQQTGEIRAMVGGRSHERMLELNRAWYDPDAGCCTRQPGSAFKPLAVYLPALERGFTAASIINDTKKEYPAPEGPWSPRNFDDTYLGPTTLREAVRRSVNTVAVQVLDAVGVDNGYASAERLGIGTLVSRGRANDRNLSMALGGLTRGVSVIDMARAYAAIANGGQRIEAPLAIRKVVDANGNILEENRPRRSRAVDQDYTYLMTNILRSNVEPQPDQGWIRNSSTGGRALIPGWPTAGKTGTTSNNKDVWFAGFTPRYTAAVWIGYDNAKSAGSLPRSISSGNQPALIFRDTMITAHLGLAPAQFALPPALPGLVEKEIAANSGKLAGPGTNPAWVRREIFIAGTEPQEMDNTWVRLTVCKERPEGLYDPMCGCTPEERFFALAYGPDGQPASLPAGVVPAPAASCLGMPVEPAPNTGGPVSLNLTVGRGGFHPAIIVAPSGAKVHLQVTSTDVAHRVEIPDHGVSLEVPAGGTATAEFTAGRPGAYLIRCGLHPGEIARLTVT